MLWASMHAELQKLLDRVKAATGYPVSITGDSEMATHSRMAPDTDPGIDLSQEYGMAMDLFKGQGGK